MDQPTVHLPHTWRPFGARVAGTLFGGMLVALCVVVWIEFGADIRGRFTFLQRSTLVLLGLMAFACWYALVRSRVRATDRGVIVVNGYRKRAFEWAQIVGVNLRRGAPWAGMDLSDGTSISLVGIQGSDGSRAVTAVRQLRALIAVHSPPETDAEGS